MSSYKLTWSKNLYDNDGDVYKEGLFIHLGNGTILYFSNSEELNNFNKDLQDCIEELQ